APNGQAPNGQAPNGQAPNGQAPNGQAPNGAALPSAVPSATRAGSGAHARRAHRRADDARQLPPSGPPWTRRG
ncbi:MAG: hypothetical protein ACRDNS_09025, partial [Trebonia sp.]